MLQCIHTMEYYFKNKDKCLTDTHNNMMKLKIITQKSKAHIKAYILYDLLCIKYLDNERANL